MIKLNAIAVIYSPKTLLDFIWYYTTYGKDYEWDAVVIPYGADVKKIQPYLKKTGIFRNIIVDANSEELQSIWSKILLFFQMLLYFLMGKQRTLCKKYIRKRFNIDEYSLIVVPSFHKTLMSILVAVSDEYRTVILEDGTLDYSIKKEKFEVRDLFHFWNILGYFLAKTGYGATVQSNYAFDKTRFCEKFATKPERMNYRNYKSMQKLNDMSICNMDLYKKIIERLYPLPLGIDRADMILCTYPFTDYVSDDSSVVKEIQNYINNNYKDSVVLLKKHPRDKANYRFDSSIKVIEIAQIIPAEIFLTYYKVESFIFTWPSTILFSVDEEKCKINVLFFEQVNLINNNYKVSFDEYIKTLGVQKKNIIQLR